jgi:hypothetical protein
MRSSSRHYFRCARAVVKNQRFLVGVQFDKSHIISTIAAFVIPNVVGQLSCKSTTTKRWSAPELPRIHK